MARSSADIQVDLDALRSARASGARRIVTQTGGVRKEVEFRSDAEMVDAIMALERELSSRPAVRVTYVASSKGFSG